MKTGFESFLQFIEVMMENKQRINFFQIAVEFNQFFQVFRVPVFIK
jgi:hypothetical protein